MARGLNRSCYRRDGKPKARLDQREAERRAAARPPRELADAYQCSECGYWHIGTARSGR